jgi:hypothetical protein
MYINSRKCFLSSAFRLSELTIVQNKGQVGGRNWPEFKNRLYRACLGEIAGGMAKMLVPFVALASLDDI